MRHMDQLVPSMEKIGPDEDEEDPGSLELELESNHQKDDPVVSVSRQDTNLENIMAFVNMKSGGKEVGDKAQNSTQNSVSAGADSSTLKSTDTPELSHRYPQQIRKPPERLRHS